MTRGGPRTILGGACLVALAACSGGAQDGPGATSAAAPTTTVDAAPVATAAPSTSTSAAAPPRGPELAASNAPAAEREAAALEILRGNTDARQLAVEATDNGGPLDPTLRDKISPRAAPPKVKMGQTTVTGKLPPEVIQRIVRQNFGRFRLCYENALKSDPTAEGKVEVKFTIDATGAVSKVGEGASTVKDAAMRSCVTKAFNGLSFPQPEAGIVTVVYPISFEPPIE